MILSLFLSSAKTTASSHCFAVIVWKAVIGNDCWISVVLVELKITLWQIENENRKNEIENRKSRIENRKSIIENRKSKIEWKFWVSQSVKFQQQIYHKTVFIYYIIMIPLQLQESQRSAKTKKVFHFFGDYTQKWSRVNSRRNTFWNGYRKVHVL